MKLAKILLYDSRTLDDTQDPVYVKMRLMECGRGVAYSDFEPVYIFQAKANRRREVIIPPVKQIIEAKTNFVALDLAIGVFEDYVNDVKLKLQADEVEQRR